MLQKISDPVLTTCTACGAERFVKQLTAAGFQLKGSGWYATDFRGGPKPPADDAAAKPADPAATPDSTAAAAAPAAGGSAPAAAPASGAAGDKPRPAASDTA